MHTRTPVGKPKPRALLQFQNEVLALLTVQGYTPGSAKRAVLRHQPLVLGAWEKNMPPCATADQLLEIEKGTLADKGGKRRDP